MGTNLPLAMYKGHERPAKTGRRNDMPIRTQRCRAPMSGAVLRRWLMALIVAMVASLAVDSALAQGAATPAGSPAAEIPPVSCPVTIPNGDLPPFGNLGFFPGPVFHGENGIWA